MKKGRKKIFRFVLRDLEIVVISFAVIMIWRGVWNLLDHYVLPSDFLLSNTLSIVAGVLIVFLNNFDLEELNK